MQDKFANIRVQIPRIRKKVRENSRVKLVVFVINSRAVLTPRIRQDIASIRVQTSRIPVKFASI